MTAPLIQPSFSAGELGPQMWGRVELAKYHVGARTMRNMFVEYRGGASNRPGTAVVGRCKVWTKPVRVIPFQFSTLQTYALEFGHLYMRVIMNGGYVLETAVNVTAVTQANPCHVTAPAHGFSNGDTVAFANIGGMYQLNVLVCLVANVTANEFDITDLDGVNISSLLFNVYTAGGTVARVYTKTSPYSAADLALLKYVQSADVMTLTHTAYSTYNLTRTAHINWTFTAETFVPTITTPTAVSAVPSAAGATTYKYVVTAIANNGVTESLPSNVVLTAASAIMSTTAGAKVTVTWNALAAATAGFRVYRTVEIQGGAPSAGMLYGFVGATDATGTSFVDENITPDFTQCPPVNYNPFAAGNNPGCSTYFQGRQFFAGSTNVPQGIWASRSADFKNMGYSSPSRADDAIERTLNSTQVNQIKHLVPMNSLIALTAKGAWRIDGGTQSDVITPSSWLAVPQATNGASDVPPLIINYDVLYVQAKGSIVRDLHLFNFFSNIYTGDDLSTLSSHLFFGHQITEWCWAEEPYRLVWAVREDGKMLSLAYLKDQEIYGWSPHDTRGLFQSTCSITEGQEDAVYLVVKRIIGGKVLQFVERMASRNFNNVAEQGWFVDCGKQTALEYPNATLTPAAAAGGLNITAATIVFGGAGYTSPLISIEDPTGTGAVLNATVVAGVITAVTISSSGSGYTAPVLTVTDTTGSGAIIYPQVTGYVNMSSDGVGIVGTDDIGKTFRGNFGRGDIISVTGLGDAFVVDLHVPMTFGGGQTWPMAPNAWSIAAKVSTIIGLDHLDGETVSVLADGGVQSQKVVTGGSITLDSAASLVTVGLPYVAQLETLTPEINGQPSIQGARQKISGFTVRVYNSRGIKFGPDFDHLDHFSERTTEEMGVEATLITGDETRPSDPLWQAPGKFCFQMDDPLPGTILAVVPNLDAGDTPS